MPTVRHDSTSGHAKGSRKETKIQKFMLRDTTNVKHKMYDYIVNNCSHRSSNKIF
jgi:hypothetical protein